ncbi:hypothetical protein FJZ40_01945 [Candidatus Shapirobacteria bacterium]|nr:hypothetical protein [Candidatus Shapirobacteria bacterium]MBM3283881.1 hypothetical protein [Candidatus Gottesmanbacteria bacterium]
MRNISNSEKLYTKEYGDEKIGKLWFYAKDLIEHGKKPLFPAESFYLNWNGTTKELAIMCKKILNYLKFKPSYPLRVNFAKGVKSPGQFELHNSNAKITINEQFQKNSTACAAILAHEITHLVLYQKGCKEDDAYENERFTDFASVYFGLGILILNGKHISYKSSSSPVFIKILGLLTVIYMIKAFLEDPTEIFYLVMILAGFYLFFSRSLNDIKVENTFGYWDADQYYTIFAGYLIRNNLDWDNVAKYIKKGTRYAGLSD